MKYYKAKPDTLYDQNVKLAFNVLMSLKKWRKNIPFQFSLLSQNAVQWSSYHIKEKRIDLHSQLSTNSEIALQTKCMYVNVHFSYRFLSFTAVTGFLNRWII